MSHDIAAHPHRCPVQATEWTSASPDPWLLPSRTKHKYSKEGIDLHWQASVGTTGCWVWGSGRKDQSMKL